MRAKRKSAREEEARRRRSLPAASPAPGRAGRGLSLSFRELSVREGKRGGTGGWAAEQES
jgi:hypothetical protein